MVLKSPDGINPAIPKEKKLKYIEIIFFVFATWSVMVGLICPWGPIFGFKMHKNNRYMVDPSFYGQMKKRGITPHPKKQIVSMNWLFVTISDL